MKSLFFYVICILNAVNDIECIVGGRNAKLGEFPYHVSCLRPDNSLCSGVILGPRFILTNAICADHSNGVTDVIAGTVFSTKGGTKIKIEKVILHPEIESHYAFFGSNTALLRTAENIEFTKNIQAGSLSSSDVLDGILVNATGWGENSECHLQYLTQSTMKSSSCKTRLQDSRISSNHICTNNKFGEGFCYSGDDGSPLVNGNGYVVGIASVVGTSIHRGKGNLDIYMDVYEFKDWIEGVMNTGSKSYRSYILTAFIVLQLIITISNLYLH